MSTAAHAPWAERHQVALYLVAVALAVLVGWTVPGASALGPAVTPVLGLLLFATFLVVPFAALRTAFADLRFLTAVLVLNFAVVPLLVFVLSRAVAGHDALLLGVLLVLLTPCVDYVIAFTRLAGGAADRLLAAAPLLLLLQMLLLPLYLLAFAGAEAVALVEPGPFVEAFIVLILLPLAAAAAVQRAARRSAAARTAAARTASAMVPLMALTLFTVVASQVRGVGEQLAELVAVLPLYAAFPVLMVPAGVLAARLAGLDVPDSRALVFSGATRNSLVVLPLALALPERLALTPFVVVAQTLVELVAMVVLVRLVPALVRTPVLQDTPRAMPSEVRRLAVRGRGPQQPSSIDTEKGSAMTDQDEGIAKVRELIQKTRIAMLTHADEHGHLISKPMATQDVDFDGTVYFIAERTSDQVQDLQQRPSVNVAYAGEGAWVSLTGTALVLHDEAKLRELWDTFTGAWLEGGPENPDNVLIEVTGRSAEYWDTPGSGKVTQVANLVKSKVTGDTVTGDKGVVDL